MGKSLKNMATTELSGIIHPSVCLRRNPVRKTWRSAIAISNAISRSCRHMNHCSLRALFDSCIRQTSPLRRNVHIDAIISPAPTSIRQTESTKIQRKFTHDRIYYKSERITLADISYFQLIDFVGILFCFLPLASCDEARRTFNIWRYWLLVLKDHQLPTPDGDKPAAGASNGSWVSNNWLLAELGRRREAPAYIIIYFRRKLEASSAGLFKPNNRHINCGRLRAVITSVCVCVLELGNKSNPE